MCAVIQMGAIVQEIKGSVGGTTFKKQGNSFVMQRKSNGTSYARLLNNVPINYARYIFVQWNELTEIERQSWIATAMLYQFPDKFGQPKYLSGRQLFTKSNITLQQYNYQPSATGFTTVTSAFTIVNGTIDYANQACIVYINQTSNIPMVYRVSIEISITPLNQPTYTRRKILTLNMRFIGLSSIAFGYQVWYNYPFITPDYKVRVYLESMNTFGILTPQQAFNLVTI